MRKMIGTQLTSVEYLLEDRKNSPRKENNSSQPKPIPEIFKNHNSTLLLWKKESQIKLDIDKDYIVEEITKRLDKLSVNTNKTNTMERENW